MSRIYEELLKKVEQKPLNILEREIEELIKIEFSETEIEYLFGGPISLSDFIHFLIFEAVSQYIKNSLNTHPLHHYTEGSYDLYKRMKRELKLRKQFVTSAIARYKPLLSIETANWLPHSPNYRQGYNLTELQWMQLLDKDDFFIKKVHEFRRFRDSKNSTSTVVKDYYSQLVDRARKCQQASCAKQKVLGAICLNDFENTNMHFFLYHVAEYCVQHGITTITPTVERSLLALTAIVHFSNINVKVFHKPVLYLHRFIASVLSEVHSNNISTNGAELSSTTFTATSLNGYTLNNCILTNCSLMDCILKDSTFNNCTIIGCTAQDCTFKDCALDCYCRDIHRYLDLSLYGFYLRAHILPQKLNIIKPTYEDIYAYMNQAPFANYNIFKLYKEPSWDNDGKTITLLRKLIDILTVDPLSM